MLKDPESFPSHPRKDDISELLEPKIIPMSDETFRLLRDLIRNYCGLYFDDSSKYLLERRLSRRVMLLNLNDFRDYYRFLLYDSKKEEELSAIMDILTVNETYFFREMNLLKAFSEEILPELREKNTRSKKLRIWSGGCSTGEEPYTIAMLILEDGRFFGWDIQITGSDISQRVLQVARKGVYGKNSFRQTDSYYIKKYFREEGAGLWRIKDSVKELVTFSYLNLLDPFRTRLIETMDVIFCRNVLIYFDMESRKKVIDMFYNKLCHGGYLLLGHAESLLNISSSFVLRHLKNDVVYQKILPGNLKHGEVL
ncbi:MAG: protein-glutamate O-methyltransferase CheR [Thermodesulfovibrionales bacterium]|nr:protein-glutamate O-methyltransferase CheR [Thermodesulfovibrionales bacterium]